jgi:transcriptional regulator with XRE-family HTH domain
MAYLLGARDGTKISRYERFARTPSLETALAYEAILGTPVKELFAGAYARAERTALRRARLLKKRLAASGGNDFPRLRILGEVAPDHGQPKLAA